MQYQHTQRGTATVAACGTGIVALVAWSVFLPVPIGFVLTVIAVLIACAIYFSSLTIQVTDQKLSWRFGLGPFRKALPLAAIQGTEVLRIPLLYGWGIHRTPQGWLYNVSGRQVLVIRLQDGTAVLLGTDEPERLQTAVRRTSDTMREKHFRTTADALDRVSATVLGCGRRFSVCLPGVPMPSPTPRALFRPGPEGLEIVVPAVRNVVLLLLLAAWLIGWLFGELTAFAAFARLLAAQPSPGQAFLGFWLIFWTLGGGFAALVWLWMLGGAERLLMGGSVLML